MYDLLPSLTVETTFVVFAAARFQNQRWIKAIGEGKRGSWWWVPFFVETTGFVALAFSLAFLIAYGVDRSFLDAISLFGLGLVGGLVLNVALGFIFGGDNFVIWFVSTLVLWPLAFVLAPHVTWFGLLP